MKVMISQPMRGKTLEQIQEERKSLVEELEKKGFEVIDTVLKERAPDECDAPVYYLAKSIEIMSKVDAVVFMQGWEDARGCRIEHQVASAYGKFIKYV
jgi:Asp-tRNA(Asn)/Glu-tRNA(Gln) amidotransferase A subunit family amidase